MNKTILQGKWRRMRGNLKTEWGRLTENDRRQLDGKLEQMLGLVQERYGYTQEGAANLLTHYLGDYGKRRHAQRITPATLWRPAMAVLGIGSLSAMGWFFFSRFLTATPPVTPEPLPEEDYFTSPEMDLT